MMDTEYMLTTIDNPYDPFEDFDSWLMFDKEKGYNCCEKVARIAQLSDDMSEKEINEETVLLFHSCFCGFLFSRIDPWSKILRLLSYSYIVSFSHFSII